MNLQGISKQISDDFCIKLSLSFH
ncbi:hypothetical protein NC653_006461 [Populus alba x Populus x berolinensis]|uniref:Uncharacterized protein n=1 Tax=Populus alba x Populus x berolinensis TaxID=444605 RepID=A0AAD6WCM9_9ROSI|nr:hypothetical protein NC653_006461 [Populus alba x Populus x berolinensis]